MSNCIVHWISGVVAVSILLLLNHFFAWNLFDFTIMTCVLIGAITFFYSILPDIDHPISVIRIIVFGVIFLLIGILAYFGQIFPIIFISLSAVAIMLLKHRGITHTIPLAVLLPLPLLLLGVGYYAVGVVSYGSHLVMDNEMKVA